MKLTQTLLVTAIPFLAACMGISRKPVHPILTAGIENVRKSALRGIGTTHEGIQENGDSVMCEEVDAGSREAVLQRGFSERTAISAAQEGLQEACRKGINSNGHCQYFRGSGEIDEEDRGLFRMKEEFACGTETVICHAAVAPVIVESSMGIDRETQKIIACARAKVRDLQGLKVERGGISGGH